MKKNENILNFEKGKPFSHYYEFSKCLEYLRFPMFRIGEEIFRFISIFFMTFYKNTISCKYLYSKGGLLERISITEQIVDGTVRRKRKCGFPVNEEYKVCLGWVPNHPWCQLSPSQKWRSISSNLLWKRDWNTIACKCSYSKSLSWKYDNQVKKFLFQNFFMELFLIC